MSIQHHTRRRFDIASPLDRDEKVLVFVEHQWDQVVYDGGTHVEPTEGKVTSEGVILDSCVSRVLTEQGWEPFEPWAVLPLDRMPRISGMDIARNSHITKQLEEMVERLVAKWVN